MSLYLVHRASFSNSFYFFTNLIHLVFFTILLICLYVFRTNRSIIRRIKCLITQAASGVVPSVVDLSWVAVGVTPTATNDRSATEGTTPETACVIKHLILLMMDRLVRNM